MKTKDKKQTKMQVVFADAKSVTNMCDYERELERKRILKLIEKLRCEWAGEDYENWKGYTKKEKDLVLHFRSDIEELKQKIQEK